MSILAIDFPPLSRIVEYKNIGFDGPLGFNKIALTCMIAVGLTFIVFILGNKKKMVPTGMQNIAEMSVEFIQDGIILQTIGEEGLGWTPFMLSLFFYIFFTNIFEVIPFFQMPVSARIALPFFLAMLTWFMFNIAGFRSQGLHYLKSSLFPPGVPKALYLLVTPIEFVSIFLVRPFSLMVRLFANLLAGHILLVTFAVLASALWIKAWYAIFLPLPVFAIIFFTAFEILVSFLQAYVFTLLAGVYIGGAMHPEH